MSDQQQNNVHASPEQHNDNPPVAIPTMPIDHDNNNGNNLGQGHPAHHLQPPPHPVMLHQVPPQHQIPIQIANNGQQQFIIPQHPTIIQHPPPPPHPHSQHPHPSQQGPTPTNGQSIHPQHPHPQHPPPQRLFS